MVEQILYNFSPNLHRCALKLSFSCTFLPVRVDHHLQSSSHHLEWMLQQTEEDDVEYSSQDVLRRQSDGIHELGLEETVGNIARQDITLERQESSTLLVSNIRIESDWSDEERENLIKYFVPSLREGKRVLKCDT